MLKDRVRSWYQSDWTMLGIVISIYLIWRIGTVGGWSKECWILLLVSLIGVKRDQIDVSWQKFFLVAIPLLGMFYYFYGSGNSIWWRIANWMFENNDHPWHWDNFMKSIPFNDGMWVRNIYHYPSLDRAMTWVYNYGFVLTLWIGIVRSFWTKSIKKMLSYALSGHLLQFPLILPFYNLILLREVWWVNKQPDLLGRTFATENDLLVNVMNCFPSMHTSISFAMLLLALREKDRVFKYIMVAYSSTVIYSTMYLQIHWVLDVLAGMVFAYATVKIADLVLHLASKWLPATLKNFYKKETVPAKNTIAA